MKFENIPNRFGDDFISQVREFFPDARIDHEILPTSLMIAGYQIEIKNIVVSIQFSPFHSCTVRHYKNMVDMGGYYTNSPTAEITIYNMFADVDSYLYGPVGYQTPEDVLLSMIDYCG